MATLYYVEHAHIAQTRTRIPTHYFCIGQESDSESAPETGSLHPQVPVVTLFRIGLKYLRIGPLLGAVSVRV